jgi:hypothetical protein
MVTPALDVDNAARLMALDAEMAIAMVPTTTTTPRITRRIASIPSTMVEPPGSQSDSSAVVYSPTSLSTYLHSRGKSVDHCATTGLALSDGPRRRAYSAIKIHLFSIDSGPGIQGNPSGFGKHSLKMHHPDRLVHTLPVCGPPELLERLIRVRSDKETRIIGEGVLAHLTAERVSPAVPCGLSCHIVGMEKQTAYRIGFSVRAF